MTWMRMARSGREERSVIPFSSGREVEELIFRVIRSLQSYLRGSAISISNGQEVIKFSFSVTSQLNL